MVFYAVFGGAVGLVDVDAVHGAAELGAWCAGWLGTADGVVEDEDAGGVGSDGWLEGLEGEGGKGWGWTYASFKSCSVSG